MKKITFILFLTLFSSAYAQYAPKDWQVREIDGSFELALKSAQGISSEMTVMAGEPKLLSVKKYGSDVVAIVYSAGQSGTTVLVESLYALLYNTKSKKFLGDFPVEYKVSSGAPYTFDQPVWKIEGNSLRIIDENSNIDAEVKL